MNRSGLWSAHDLKLTHVTVSEQQQFVVIMIHQRKSKSCFFDFRHFLPFCFVLVYFLIHAMLLVTNSDRIKLNFVKHLRIRISEKSLTQRFDFDDSFLNLLERVCK